MANIDYRALKQAESILVENIKIPMYFSDYVVKNVPKYSKLRGNTDLTAGPVICPFHAEQDPSFHYVAKGQYYNCFSCSSTKGKHSGGNVVHLHKEILSLIKHREASMLEAISTLAEIYKIKIPPLEIIQDTENSNFMESLQAIFNEKQVYSYKSTAKVSLSYILKLRRNANEIQCMILDNVYALIKSGQVILKDELDNIIKENN